MQIKINSKYLIFPVNTLSTVKTLTFKGENAEDYSMQIHLDNFSSNFRAYIDVSRYMGKTLTLSVEPQMEIRFEESDVMDIPSLYEETYRPRVHFTAKNGWINDPNGLIYFEGKYHMFYQHNPCAPRWGNMHWGHAVSEDLLYWEETDIALFPDKTGMMYSGSAISDEKNLLGLQTGDRPTGVLFYTATAPFSQYIAYSTDSFRTIKKYGPPVVPNIVRSNRDPKVVFCEEWNAYAMILFLREDVYGILRSDDLIHWDLIQEISLPDDSECPDLFPITADDGKRLWVLMGAHDRYLVGHMNEKGFSPIQEPRRLHYGKGAYAGQTISGMPNGRVVRIDWEMWRFSVPSVRGQMSFPAEMTLKMTNGEYVISALPIKEIETLYDKSSFTERLRLCAGTSERIPLDPEPYLIKAEAEPQDANVHMKIFGITVIFSGKENLVKISDKEFPISLTRGKWEVVMLVDRCSIELYLDGGKIYSATVDDKMLCDYNLSYLEITAKADCQIDNVEIHSLKSIWKNNK